MGPGFVWRSTHWCIWNGLIGGCVCVESTLVPKSYTPLSRVWLMMLLQMCILHLTFKEYKVAAYADPHTQTTLTGLCPFRGVERTPASDAGSISTTSARTHEPCGCATIVPLFGLAPSPARWASKAT